MEIEFISEYNVKSYISDCQLHGDIQQVAFSTYHNSLTQICFTCGKVRTSIKKEDLKKQKEEICECGHKQWEEHKCTFEPMVAQECNVKGCKCKKFVKRKEEKF